MVSLFITFWFALLHIVLSLQRAERHFGCPPGKNVCIYPIDDSQLQCETIIDFQAALHIPAGESSIRPDFRNAMNITLTLPNGEVTTPENLFGVKPEMRTWELSAFESFADQTPDRFKSFAVTYRNVRIPRKLGKGPIHVSVTARSITTEVRWFVRMPTKRRAKNVILFVGDGMTPSMLAAARLVSRGMSHGKYNDKMFMQEMPYHAMQNTAGVDSIITDSANSASAFNTGQKSSFSAMGVSANSGDDVFALPKQETIAEHVKRRFGMSVGVVTTSEIQDATPAAVWAHVRRRDEKPSITSQAINGCQDCAFAVQPDVLMGGGGKYFLPAHSIDGSNMYFNYSDKGYTVTHTRAEMRAAAADPETKKLLTISHFADMEVWLDRNVYTDNKNVSDNSPTGDGTPPLDQPNLDEMVMSAVEMLSRNQNGFYLMVEAASIDKAAHRLDIPRALSDLIEMDNTVGKVMKWAKEHGDDTLVLATSDHAHGFDVFGTVDTRIWDGSVVASEENPVSDVEHQCASVTDNAGNVFGIEKEETTQMPIREANIARRQAIGIYNISGYPDYEDKDGDHFPDSWDVRTVLAAGMNNFPDHTEDYKVSSSMRNPAVSTTAGFLNNPVDDPNGIFMSGNIISFSPWDVHTFQDVDLFGYGPGAEKVRGNVDNTEIFHIIASVLGFGTNGRIDPEKHLYGDFVKCVNVGHFCHCESVEGEHMCSCKHKGPQTFVLPSTPLCRVNGAVLIPMTL